MSVLSIDALNINDIQERLIKIYGLIVHSVSSIDRSFERALSICLFQTEDEVDSISDTLYRQHDLLYDNRFNQHISFVMVAAKLYRVTIYIDENNSENIYEIEIDSPVVHLIKTKLQDGSDLYLATEKKDDINEVNLTGTICVTPSSFHKEEDAEYDSCQSNNIKKLQVMSYSNATIRQIVSDGNCYFRAVSDQLSGSQEGHIVLRALIIDFISQNRQKFEPYIDREHFSSWEDFLYRMRQHGTFADGTIIVASAISLRKQVIIHACGQRPVLFQPGFPNTNHDQIHLLYDSNSLHYNSLWSIDGTKLHIDTSECILFEYYRIT